MAKKSRKAKKKSRKQRRKAWKQFRKIVTSPAVATVVSGLATALLYRREQADDDSGKQANANGQREDHPLANIEMWKDIAVNVLANVLTPKRAS